MKNSMEDVAAARFEIISPLLDASLDPVLRIAVFCQVKIPEMSVRIPSFCTGNFPVLSGMGRADQETATFCRINACSIR